MFDLAIHRGKTSRWATIITLLALLGMVSTPTALAQEGTEVPSTEVTATEVATEVPTDVPTQAPTEIPTQVATETPTQMATDVPTEAPATELPAARSASNTSLAATEDAPEILPNTDSLTATAPTEPITLDPGVDQPLDFTYHVTTHRTGTAIRAELRLADGSLATGWGLSAQAGGGEWLGGDAAVDVSEWGTLAPDTAFTLSLIVTSPAEVTAEQTVSLWISSTASTARGETEIGVEANASLATLTVVPPPIPNTDTLAATSSTESVTLEPGGTQQYNFTYNVTTPRTGTSIVADLRLRDGSPAIGWTIAAQAGGGEVVTGDAAVETGEWATLAPGTFPLTITVTAPAEVAAEQTATLWIASTTATDLGIENAVAAVAPLASLTVTSPPMIASSMDISPMSVDPDPGTCTQVSDSDIISPENPYVRFSCTTNSSGNTDYTIGIPSDGWESRWGFTTISESSGFARIGSTGQKHNFVKDGPLLIDLRPTATGATNSGQMTVTIGTAATLDARKPTCSRSASASGAIDFGVSSWTGSGYEKKSGALAISITSDGAGCTDASTTVTAQVTAMTRDSGSEQILPDAMSFDSGSSVTGVTALPVASFDGSAQSIASVTGDVNTIWDATFSVSPPADLPPGLYTDGTITISTDTGS